MLDRLGMMFSGIIKFIKLLKFLFKFSYFELSYIAEGAT
jgi:hypothetical protein